MAVLGLEYREKLLQRPRHKALVIPSPCQIESPLVDRDHRFAPTRRWRKWIRTCMGLFLSSSHFWFVGGSLFGAGNAVLRPVACDQVRGARGRGQGTENGSKAWRRAA